MRAFWKTQGGWVVNVTLLAFAAGCGDDQSPGDGNAGSGGGGSEPGVLKVASSWSSPSEQEALQVTLEAFQRQTGATVEVVALAQDRVERIEQYQNSDWDVAQDNFFNLSTSFADGNGGFHALDLSSVSELEASLAQVFPKVRDALSAGGEILGLPMNLHRENTLHYSTSLQDPPTTLAELRGMCDDHVAAGGAGPKPLAIAPADWLYRILFESMLPPDVVAATAENPRPSFLAAGEVIQHYLENDCLWIAPTEHGWQEAAGAVLDGEALMYIHGDWAKGYLVQLGATPGVEFDVAPAPGSTGAFYYGIDTFAVNESSPRLDLAIEFARIALTPEVQAGFSMRKGSTPGILFEDPSAAFTDSSLRATYLELEASLEAGTAFPISPWLGTDGATLLVPLRDGAKTADQVATDFMTVYPSGS
jgi:glucose/mannose transport system substrate-binding protein